MPEPRIAGAQAPRDTGIAVVDERVSSVTWNRWRKPEHLTLNDPNNRYNPHYRPNGKGS
jgi:hypothetical protein